jgi:hypothetical protein
MLAGMDIPVAAAAPWIVLAAVLGMLLLVSAGLAVRRRERGRTTPEPEQDDLPGFLESPPGVGAPHPTSGWAVLATPPAPPEPPAGRRSPVAALTAAGAALLLLAGVAAVAVSARSEDRSPGDRSRATAAPEDLAVELAFGGVVLERRPVGVTATYPRLVVTSDGGQDVAEVELPTYNCLTAEAPDDPEAAGCTPAGTEHARLTSPELTLESGEDGEVRVSGRFPTWLHPNGSPPEPTGRAYEIDVAASPDGRTRGGEWVPATGTLRLGEDSAPSTGGAADRLRVG